MKTYILATLITLLIVPLVFGGLVVMAYLLTHYTLLSLLWVVPLWKEVYDTLKKYQHSNQEEEY